MEQGTLTRTRKGLQMTRLTRKQVLAIREMWELGETIREIAKQYKRAESTISDVVHRRTYVRVKPGEVARVPGAQESKKYETIKEQYLEQQQRDGKRRY